MRDARHLGDALDAVASVAELGVEAFREITGDDATFFEAGHVDMPTLERLVATAGDAEDDLTRAAHQPERHRGRPVRREPGSATPATRRSPQVDPLLDDLAA